MDLVSKPEQKPPRKRARLGTKRRDAEAVVNGESLTARCIIGVANQLLAGSNNVGKFPVHLRLGAHQQAI